MPTPTKPFSCVIAFVLVGACAQGVLRVDQDRYSAGTSLQSLQGSVILGPPDGDRFGLVVPPASISDDGPGTIGRAVRIGDRIEFIAQAHDAPDRYQVVWTGAREATTSGVSLRGVTQVILRDDAGDEALRIRYQFNQLEIIWDGDSPGPVTLQPSVPHEVSVVLHMRGATSAADVTVTQGDTVILSRPNLSLIDGEFTRLEVVEVRTDVDYYMKDLIAVAAED